MAIEILSWMLAVPLLGLATGLRTMTPMAVLCWFAYLGYLPVQGTWASWTARLTAAIVFSVFALGEYIGDKLPQTPNRIAPPLLLGRLAFGGFIGAITATAMTGPGIEGVLLGVVGAVLGTFAGFMVRRELVRRLGCADWPVALAEDLIAVASAFFAMHVITN